MHLKLVNQIMVCLLNTSGIKVCIIQRLLENPDHTSWKLKPLGILKTATATKCYFLRFDRSPLVAVPLILCAPVTLGIFC